MPEKPYSVPVDVPTTTMTGVEVHDPPEYEYRIAFTNRSGRPDEVLCPLDSAKRRVRDVLYRDPDSDIRIQRREVGAWKDVPDE